MHILYGKKVLSHLLPPNVDFDGHNNDSSKGGRQHSIQARSRVRSHGTLDLASSEATLRMFGKIYALSALCAIIAFQRDHPRNFFGKSIVLYY